MKEDINAYEGMAVEKLQVIVEYNPADVDRFIDIADAVEERFPSLMVDGQEVDGDAADGKPMFEVKAQDGRSLFSAREMGRFPDSAEILDAITAAGVPES